MLSHWSNLQIRLLALAFLLAGIALFAKLI